MVRVHLSPPDKKTRDAKPGNNDCRGLSCGVAQRQRNRLDEWELFTEKRSVTRHDNNQAAKEYFGLMSVLLLFHLSLLCSVFRVFAQRSQSGLIKTFCDTEFGLFVYYDRES